MSYNDGVILTKLSFEKLMLNIYMDCMVLKYSVFKYPTFSISHMIEHSASLKGVVASLQEGPH